MELSTPQRTEQKSLGQKQLADKAMKQQGMWLLYCLSFVYEATFKFNYTFKLRSNRRQENSSSTKREKRQSEKDVFSQHRGFQVT